MRSSTIIDDLLHWSRLSCAGQQRAQPRRDARRVVVFQAHRPKAQDAVVEPTGVDIDRRAAGLQLARQLEGAAVAGTAVEGEIDQRHFVIAAYPHHRDTANWQALE